MKIIKIAVAFSLLNVAAVVVTVAIFDGLQLETKSSAAANQLQVAPAQTPATSQIASGESTDKRLSQAIPTSKPATTPNPTSALTPTPAPKKKIGCLVVINGVRYDLGPFRKLHSGGDIFQCNTDMTTIFYQQHSDSYISALDIYRIQ